MEREAKRRGPAFYGFWGIIARSPASYDSLYEIEKPPKTVFLAS
jgi:hypothetical protein